MGMDSLFSGAYNLPLHQVHCEPDRFNGRAVDDFTPDVALRGAEHCWAICFIAWVRHRQFRTTHDAIFKPTGQGE